METKDYDYRATDGTCRYQPSKTLPYKNKGIANVPLWSESALKEAVAGQVVSVAIEADQPVFHLYQSGVINDYEGCGITTDHGVAVVGYDATQRFWIVRNSWGS